MDADWPRRGGGRCFVTCRRHLWPTAKVAEEAESSPHLHGKFFCFHLLKMRTSSKPAQRLTRFIRITLCSFFFPGDGARRPEKLSESLDVTRGKLAQLINNQSNGTCACVRNMNVFQKACGEGLSITSQFAQ